MTWHWPKPNRSIGALDAIALIGLVGLLVARFVPIARLPFWGCVFREQFGWPCLGCGLTRVADRMSHFNVAGAWDANPLGTLFALGFMIAIVWSALHLLFKVPVPDVQLSARAGRWSRIALGVAVLLNWVWVVVKFRYPEQLA